MTEKVRYTLPRSARLITQRDFRRVYSRGARAHGRSLILVATLRRGRTCRLGVSVSKAHGPAVRRNKIKRLLREAFRLERPTLPEPLDIVLIPRERDRYELAELRRELVTLTLEVVRKKPDGRRRGRGPRRGKRRGQDGGGAR